MLKRVTLVLEAGENDFELTDAYLTPDESHAFFISSHIVHYTMASRTQNHRIYVECGARLILGKTHKGEITIFDLHEKLQVMTAYELLNFHVLHDADKLNLIR
ncbi:hypothetical protein ACJ7K1_24755 [Paenibacillus elgii]